MRLPRTHSAANLSVHPRPLSLAVRQSLLHAMRRTSPVIGLGLAGALMSAQAQVFTTPIELSSLDGTNGFALNGVTGGESVASIRSVSSAGDVNGDGLDDVIIGAWGANNGVGTSYVVFGSEHSFTTPFEFSSLSGNNGFAINGVSAGDNSGFSVSTAGDINGDGIDDVIIGALQASPNGNISAGTSYVVFGSDQGFSTPFELASLDGTNGFALNGVAADDNSGRSVSAAGDVNGDGIDDVIIGADRASSNGISQAGTSYVVFGSDQGFSTPFELSSLDGTNGFALNGVAVDDNSGFSVAAAGDVNGDGVDDVIIGARFADPNGNESGVSYVVFGTDQGFTTPFELSNLDGTNGFALNGVAQGDRSGYSVSSAGDFNGDGIDDVIIGAVRVNPYSAGTSYVVFGTDQDFTTPVELSSLDGTTGFALNGVAVDDWTGFSVAAAGDVNGDGLDDVIIGAPFNSRNGTSFVVFGTDQGFTTPFELSNLDGTNGIALNGAENDNSGWSVGTTGDVNGDGIDDLIIGARFGGGGTSYLVFGRRPDEPVNITINAAPSSFAETGDQLTVDVNIRNTSDQPLTSVIVNDPLLGEPLCTFDLWTDFEAFCTGVHFVSDADVAAGKVTFMTRVTSNEITQPVIETLTVIRDGVPQILRVSAISSPAMFTAAGDVLTINIAVENVSDAPLTNVTVSDPLLGEPLCVAASLWPGVSAICTGLHFVTDADVQSGAVTFMPVTTSDQTTVPTETALTVTIE